MAYRMITRAQKVEAIKLLIEGVKKAPGNIWAVLTHVNKKTGISLTTLSGYYYGKKGGAPGLVATQPMFMVNTPYGVAINRKNSEVKQTFLAGPRLQAGLNKTSTMSTEEKAMFFDILVNKK